MNDLIGLLTGGTLLFSAGYVIGNARRRHRRITELRDSDADQLFQAGVVDPNRYERILKNRPDPDP